jgi:ribosomal protein S18 acetylase RimI-like enzyme
VNDPAEVTDGDGVGRTEDHVRALHANLIEHYRFHARLAASEFHHGGDVAWFLSGRQVNFLNAVMSATFAPTHAAQRVDEVLAPFQDRAVPMRWWTDERGRPAELDANLERRGLEMVWDVPGMTVDLIDGLRDEPVEGVDVRPVRTRADLRTWFGAFAAGFGFDPHRERAWHEAFEELGVDPSGRFRHYTGFVDGEAVASGTMFVDHASGSAGIYHVGTRPDRRGRGIGRAVTLVPLLEAREAGLRYGVLKASHLGRSVYEHLGFAERARLRQYRWTPLSVAP